MSAPTDRGSKCRSKPFLRPDALLAVVILTDEDDCSRTDEGFTIKDDTCDDSLGYAPIADFVSALDAVKGGRDRWAAAVMAGPQACKSSFGDAKEAVRLKEFVGKTGDNAVFSSICSGDLITPLQNALNVFDAACKKFQPVK